MSHRILGVLSFSLFITLLWAHLASATVQYFHTDQIQSSVLLTEEGGGIVEIASYTPYGEVLSDSIADESAPTDYLYTGQELDRTTELYYYGARYYDAVLSRWCSVDPMLDEKNSNAYGYVADNPVLFIDPTGRILVPGSKELNPGYNDSHKKFFERLWEAIREGKPSSFTVTAQQFFGASSGSRVSDDSPNQLNFDLTVHVDPKDRTVTVRSKPGENVKREVDVKNRSGEARLYFDSAVEIRGRIITDREGNVVGIYWEEYDGFSMKAYIPWLKKIPGIGKNFQLPAVEWKWNVVVRDKDGRLYQMAETTGPIVTVGFGPLKKVIVNGKYAGTNPDPSFRKPTLQGGEKELIEKINEILRGYGYTDLIEYKD